MLRLRTEVEELRKLKALDGLLATLTGVLDVREVFDRVSEVARPVLPHDALILGRVTPDRQSIRVWAHSAVPEGVPAPDVMEDQRLNRRGLVYAISRSASPSRRISAAVL